MKCERILVVNCKSGVNTMYACIYKLVITNLLIQVILIATCSHWCCQIGSTHFNAFNSKFFSWKALMV